MSIEIEIVRARHGRLLIERADELARVFFTSDISSRDADSYDELAIRTETPHYNRADTDAIRKGMRLPRAPEALWAWVREDAPVDLINGIASDADLISMTDEEWMRLRPTAERMLSAFVQEQPGSYRALAVTTKILHFKRRGLVPICDSYTRAMLGVRLPTSASHERQVLAGMQAFALVRREGRRNLNELRAIQEQLGRDRSLVRILDALLWTVF